MSDQPQVNPSRLRKETAAVKKTLRTFIAALCVITGLAIYPGAAARAQETPAAPTATFTVNSTADETDINPGNGVCATFVGNGVCTLRAAIMEANALAGADTISVPVGTYQITRFGDDDTGLNGDFDILDDLTINGTGLLYPIVDGNRTVIGQRVFHLVDLPIDFTLTLNRVTVRNGNGGIYNDRNRFNLNNSIVTTNLTGVSGGGIRNNQGVVNITFSQISDNSSTSGVGTSGAGGI